MSKAQEFVKELRKLTERLNELSDEFVEHFPRSSSLYRFVEEIGTAREGLSALAEEMDKAVQVADNENKMKNDLLDQIEKSPVYNKLDTESKGRLAEYLVQQGQPLASDEDLLSFAVKTIKGQDAEGIVKNLSKEFVMRLGGAGAEGSEEGPGEFDAYAAGVEQIKQYLADPEEKDKFIGLLAREYMKRQPKDTVKQFYNKVSL